MTSWSKIQFGKILSFYNGKAGNFSEAGKFPVYGSNGKIGFYDAHKFEKSLIIGRVGAYCGSIHIEHGKYWASDNTIVAEVNRGFDLRFTYLLLKAFPLHSLAGGSAQPLLNQTILSRITVNVPLYATQQKIAAILSAYDDLIENNKRRIALLEKMAEEIYREWFVRMRFPGYEKVKMAKGVPEGWEVVQFGDIANFTMGQSPKSEFYNERGDGLPFNQGVGTYGDRFPKRVTYCSSTGRKAKKGDILFSVRAPVGRLNIADCEMILGRGLAAISHRQGFNSYLFYLLRVVFANEDIIGNGSIFNAVGKDELIRFKLFCPPDQLIKMFNEFAVKIDRQIETLIYSLEKLISTRDLLLPRLISGKLSVENLDIQFPPSMREEGKIPANERGL